MLTDRVKAPFAVASTFSVWLFGLLAVGATGCDAGGAASGPALSADGDLLGEHVALDGDLALLAAPGSNEVVPFRRTAGGWVAEPALRPTEPGVPRFSFGQDVALDGGVAVVGSPEFSESDDAPGRAYVYVREGGRWAEAAVLRPDDLAPDAGFGLSVGVSGDRLVVGAGPDSGRGALHVYEWSGGQWGRVAVLRHPEPDAPPRASFGVNVALDGDRVAVAGTGGQPNGTEGRAFIYERSSPGVWDLTAVIQAPPLPSNSVTPLLFGFSMDLAGSSLAVNEPGRGDGTVYLYRESGGAWALEETLTRSRAELGPLSTFGRLLALDGDRLVAAVPGREIDGQTRGSAFVYVRRPDGTWAEEAELVPGGRVIGFGRDVDLDGDRVLVGANTSGGGGAYVFERAGGAWAERP